MAAKDYPYQEKDGDVCAYTPAKAMAKVHGAARLPADDENVIKQALATYGPVSVAIHASLKSFQNYGGGEFFFMHFCIYANKLWRPPGG